MWTFNIPWGKPQAVIFGGFLWDVMKIGQAESMTNPRDMFTNAKFRDEVEAVVLRALSAKYPATVEEYNAAPQSQRYTF